MQTNILLVIEYDGSGFSGWQTQLPGSRTVQGELQRAIEMVLREKVGPLRASGRTDAGVHACAQVVNFHASHVPDLRQLAYSVSGILRGEVAVLRAFAVPEDFDAQRSARRKCYCYTVLNREVPPVLDRGRVWYVHHRLDLELLQREAKLLEGRHDFSCFRGSDCSAKTSVREIYHSEFSIQGNYLRYRVIGNGFLKQMVRNIAGTLIDRGRGRLKLSMEEILSRADRRLAGVCAPACGLQLEWVEYEPQIMRLLQGDEPFPQV